MKNDPIEKVELSGDAFLEMLEYEKLNRIIYLFGEDEVKELILSIVRQNTNLSRRKNELLGQILIRNQHVGVTNSLNQIKEKIEFLIERSNESLELTQCKRIIKEYYNDLRRRGLLYECSNTGQNC